MTINVLKLNRLYDEATKDRDNLLAKCKGYETEIENLHNMSHDMIEAEAKHKDAMATLQSDYEAKLKAQVDLVVKIQADNKTAIETLNAEHIKAIDSLKADHAKAIETFKAIASTESASSERKAQSILSNTVGINVEQLPNAKEQVLTADEVLQKWLALNQTDKAKADQYYNQNKSVIAEASGFTHK